MTNSVIMSGLKLNCYVISKFIELPFARSFVAKTILKLGKDVLEINEQIFEATICSRGKHNKS